MKKNIERLFSALKESNADLAKEAFIEGLKRDQAIFIGEVKKQGVLRSSKYDFDSDAIKALIKFSLDKTAPFTLTLDNRNYLESILSLIYLAQTARSILKDLRSRFRKASLKNYLVTLEWVFYVMHERQTPLHLDDFRGFTKEELAEGFSFFFFEYCKIKMFSQNEFIEVDEVGIGQGVYVKDIVDICKLIELKEYEILVDCFAYEAIRDKTTVRIRPLNGDLARSIQYGFIFHQMQALGDSFELLSRTRGISLLDGSSRYYQKVKNILFEVKKHPIERIVMKFPLMPKLKEIFNQDALFQEEQIEIMMHLKELFLDFEGFKHRPIWGSWSSPKFPVNSVS